MGFKTNPGTGSNQAQEPDGNGGFKHAHIVISGLSTTGKSNIKMDFRYRRTNATKSPTNMFVYYSVNGGTNTYLSTFDFSGEGGNGTEFKDATITFNTAINDKSSVVFTLIPYGGNNGAIRFDDIKIYSAN